MNNVLKKDCYRDSLLYIVETAVLLILFSVKLACFYNYIGIGVFTPALTAASDLVVFGIFWLVSRFTRRSPMPWLKAVYAILCVIMCIDRVYFSYINRLPSWSALKMAGQLGDISDMIVTLFTFDHAAYLIDLPLWLLFSVNLCDSASKKLHVRGVMKRSEKVFRLSGIVLSAAFVIVIAVTFLGGNFKVAYLQNELITYHVSDAVNLAMNAVAGDTDADKYIQTLAESEDDGYIGAASGKNVIMIQVEALQAFAVGLEYNGQQLTPVLDSLSGSDSFFFDNYYYQVGGGNTADAEFTVLNSLYAPEDSAAYVKYVDNNFYGLPLILKDNGYSGAYAFHGYKGEFWNREAAYVSQGFDDFTSMEDYVIDDAFNLGLSDVSFFNQTADIIETLQQPFFSFLITLSSHYPYTIPTEYQTLELLPEHTGTMFGDYLQAVRYFDSALGVFIDRLKASGIYDNSVIIIYGDHYAIPSVDAQCYEFMGELLGHSYFEDDIFSVPLIIHIPGMETGKHISTVGGHVDVLPTLLYLLGIENNKSVMFGHNLITAKSNVVYEMMHMGIGSFISDDVIFSMPQSGILYNAVAMDRYTGERLDSSKFTETEQAAHKALTDCAAILDSNTVVRQNTSD